MRPKPRHLLIVLLAAACGWLAAPALSSKPYMPPAVDFEQGLPAVSKVTDRHARASARAGGHAHAGEGPVTHLSPVIEAPERFDLAGLAGELRPLELRGREHGGEWSGWTEAANGDPVWFGGADELQLRTRGWRPQGEIHYVNVSGDATPASGLLNGARATINSAYVSAAGLLGGDAEAATPRPQIIGRGEWGANRKEGGCRPRERAEYGRVKAVAVHHTVTANDYSEARAPSVILGICRYHRNGQGWNDIGYNALVDRFGNVYAGRAGGLSRAVVGAHAQGFNAQTSGVASIGTHTGTPPSSATRRALVNYIAWKLSVHKLTATGKATLTSAGGEASRYPNGKRVRTQKVIGHGTVGLTECPGGALEKQLPKVLRQVRERLEGSKPTDPTDPVDPDEPGDGGVLPR